MVYWNPRRALSRTNRPVAATFSKLLNKILAHEMALVKPRQCLGPFPSKPPLLASNISCKVRALDRFLGIDASRIDLKISSALCIGFKYLFLPAPEQITINRSW